MRHKNSLWDGWWPNTGYDALLCMGVHTAGAGATHFPCQPLQPNKWTLTEKAFSSSLARDIKYPNGSLSGFSQSLQKIVSDTTPDHATTAFFHKQTNKQTN
jgi:hypothetical protein